MLVLTRKQQETIHIGENVIITVVRIKGNAVRIGIEAPDDVRIIRGEIAEKAPAPSGRDGKRRGLVVACLDAPRSNDSDTSPLDASQLVDAKWSSEPVAETFPANAV